MNSFSDKPIITPSELISLRKLGLSYKQIGRKLGIDSHKEEVLQVYKSLDIDIEKIKAQAKVSPPTGLWYLFDSEREVIKSDILPSPTHIKELLPQNRIFSRLGNDAGYMLDMYLKVSEIITEEICSSYQGAGDSSHVGHLKKWDSGDVGVGLIRKVYEIQKAVGLAAFHLSEYELEDVGNCMCAAMKAFRFGWKEVPIPHPSFFWGCSRYIPVESGRHDKAISVRTTLWKVIDDDIKVSRISDKDIKFLQHKLSTVVTFWEGHEAADEEMLKHAISLYGGPPKITAFKSSKQVLVVLKDIGEHLIYLVDQRFGQSSNGD